MRRTSQLITQVRRETENQKTGISDGISDLEFIDFLNDAQDELLSSIYDTHPTTFHKQQVYDTGLDEITLPDEIFLRSRVVSIEYSNDGDDKHYRPLKKIEPRERRGDYQGWPDYYYMIANVIHTYPAPVTGNSAKVRITYDPRMPRLDVRQSVVQAFTVVANEITALDLDETYPDFDNTNFDEFDSLCLVDRDGALQVIDIQHNGVDAAGTVSLAGPHELLTGETIAIGQYVARGDIASTLSFLPTECERFFKSYCGYRVFLRDSSTDAERYRLIAETQKAQLVANFAVLTDDIDDIPVTDWTYHPNEDIF